MKILTRNRSSYYEKKLCYAIAIAIATQLTITSAISKNRNCQQSIATAIKLLRALFVTSSIAYGC